MKDSGSHDNGIRTGALGLCVEPELNDCTGHWSMGMPAVLHTQAKTNNFITKAEPFSRANAGVRAHFSYPVAQAAVVSGYCFGIGSRHVLHWSMAAGCYWFLGSGAYSLWKCPHSSWGSDMEMG